MRNLVLIETASGEWTLIGGGFDLDQELDVAQAIGALRVMGDQLLERLVDLKAQRLAVEQGKHEALERELQAHRALEEVPEPA